MLPWDKTSTQKEYQVSMFSADRTAQCHAQNGVGVYTFKVDVELAGLYV